MPPMFEQAMKNDTMGAVVEHPTGMRLDFQWRSSNRPESKFLYLLTLHSLRHG